MLEPKTMAKYRVTVDTGGAFSGFVFFNEETGENSLTKNPSHSQRTFPSGLARRSGAARSGSEGERHLLFLPRHHRRNQYAPRRERGEDRPARYSRFSRYLRSHGADARLRAGHV